MPRPPLSPQEEADAIVLFLAALSQSDASMTLAAFIANNTSAQILAIPLPTPAEKALKSVVGRNRGLYDNLNVALNDSTVPPSGGPPRNQIVTAKLQSAFNSFNDLVVNVHGVPNWSSPPDHPGGDALAILAH